MDFINEKIIFSDFFDTLVFRRISSFEVIKKWSAKVEKENALPARKFYKTYQKINVKLCAKKALKEIILEEHFDVVLSKVYEKLSRKYKLPEKSVFINNVSELYFKEEEYALYLNEKYEKFLRKLKEQGKKIYLVSDFYCPSSMVRRWLKSLGVDDLFDDIYVSCEYDKEKASGKLYDFILSKSDAAPEEILMIGDNRWSDNYMANAKGIHSLNISKISSPETPQIINKEWDEIFYRFGQKYVLSNHAFPLFLFTKRLYEECKKADYKDLIFMSREGQFLKKLFDYYQEQIIAFDASSYTVKTHYFYGSRNSVMTASLDSLDKEDFNLLFRFFNTMNVKSFLHSIGFTKEQIKQVGENFNHSMSFIHAKFNKRLEFRDLKENETFIKIYEENRKSQAKAFGSYMESFGIDYKKDGLVFVDIGYHGTMQDLIIKFFKGQVDIKGYFIKTRVSKKEFEYKKGLLSDMVNKHLVGNEINQYDAYNYEQILRADHGRCLGYKFDENGKVYPVIDKELDDKEVFENYVKEIQNQIFDKFKSITQKSLAEKCDITSICIIYYYFAIKHKSNKDYDWIVDMQNSSHDDFGIVGYFGRFFSKKLRNYSFKKQDDVFIKKHRRYIRHLIKLVQ